MPTSDRASLFRLCIKGRMREHANEMWSNCVSAQRPRIVCPVLCACYRCPEPNCRLLEVRQWSLVVPALALKSVLLRMRAVCVDHSLHRFALPCPISFSVQPRILWAGYILRSVESKAKCQQTNGESKKDDSIQTTIRTVGHRRPFLPRLRWMNDGHTLQCSRLRTKRGVPVSIW
jgi:hypothetical protein